jgi:polysaccharide pyruvyl transferase WcaK-like protein
MRNVTLSTDFAFAYNAKKILHPIKYLRSYMHKTMPLVGITVKECFRDDRQKKYEKEMARLIDFLILHAHATPCLIAQTTATEQHDDDRAIIRRILKQCMYKTRCISVPALNLDQTIKVYSHMRIIVATRMHSAIFALTKGIPVIAIGYEPKTLDVFDRLGLERSCIAIHDFEGEDIGKRVIGLLKSPKNVQTIAKKTLINVKHAIHEDFRMTFSNLRQIN